jgi:hypothetical protein
MELIGTGNISLHGMLLRCRGKPLQTLVKDFVKDILLLILRSFNNAISTADVHQILLG